MLRWSWIIVLGCSGSTEETPEETGSDTEVDTELGALDADDGAGFDVFD